MNKPVRYGLEQARAQLPRIVAEAQTGACSVITKHGKPYAAVMPLQELERLQTQASAPTALLELRGTGQGLWGADVGQTLAELRGEWDDRAPAE